MNYSYIKDFHKSRDKKIGASDIPKLIPHPEYSHESLAAYTDQKGQRQACTALDLYYEKVNGKDYEYSFPADMGHFLEGKALFEFIKDNIDNHIAVRFMQGYQHHKIEQDLNNRLKNHYVSVNPEPYNNTPFKHNTEATTDFGVAHADCLYEPERGMNINNSLKTLICNNDMNPTIKKNGLTIDLSKPFIIEAKSARLYTVSARKHDQYKGYDLSLKTWQGIPLKHYFQIQYQMMLYNVDVAYLSLIFDTSEKHFWQIKANKEHQADLAQLASYVKKCIDTKTPPKQLVMNSKDIKKLYPETKDDFRQVSENELTEIIDTIKSYKEAENQEKRWKAKKNDAQERLSVHLKDTGMVKGVINGELQDLCKWKKTGGGFNVAGIKEISEREDGKTIMNYLKRKKLIKEKNTGRVPSVMLKEV
jgi:hypothetical protein